MKKIALPFDLCLRSGLNSQIVLTPLILTLLCLGTARAASSDTSLTDSSSQQQRRHRPPPMEELDEATKAAFEKCRSEVGISEPGKGQRPTQEQHQKFHDCLKTQNVNLPERPPRPPRDNNDNQTQDLNSRSNSPSSSSTTESPSEEPATLSLRKNSMQASSTPKTSQIEIPEATHRDPIAEIDAELKSIKEFLFADSDESRSNTDETSDIYAEGKSRGKAQKKSQRSQTSDQGSFGQNIQSPQMMASFNLGQTGLGINGLNNNSINPLTGMGSMGAMPIYNSNLNASSIMGTPMMTSSYNGYNSQLWMLNQMRPNQLSASTINQLMPGTNQSFYGMNAIASNYSPGQSYLNSNTQLSLSTR